MALDTNLTSYWKMDEASGTRVDSVSGFNLTANGTITAPAGFINNGVGGSWSSSNNLSVADHAGLRLNSGSFSVGFAIKTSSWTPPVGSANMVLTKDGASDGWSLFLNGSGLIVFQTNSANNYVGTANLSTGAWHQVIIVNNAGSLIIYVDGAVDTAGQAFSNPASGVAAFTVGQASAQNRPLNANAVVDEVFVYSRALSAGEVTSLWNGGAGFQYPFVSAVKAGFLSLM